MNNGSSRSEVTDEFDDDADTLGPMDDDDGDTTAALHPSSTSSSFFAGVLLLRKSMSTGGNSLMGLETVMVAKKKLNGGDVM